MFELRKILELTPVIPVMTIDRIEQALPLAEALLDGGLRVLEITLRSEAALPAITAIAQAFPQAVLGAGTVLDASALRAAQAAGADFVVSPGCTDALLDAAEDNNMPILPGACTPSEVMRLLARGVTTMKFFPAEAAGGLS
ncbi:MAG TPA: bifunctional 4-hydroxy-2-oxoglutarate aldolase/2-dehydro-3-deoxy-phosphogluconate aldolase, partial [Pseudomonadaceae bacterium]|nr:bifunctional 4-hydroxy-2-oxoglutarate aldolase/2-dehydro-3-deoxy-phosphogluconate aldolase [Pseudomonadaceae bacterium]